jgi:glycosyltransferase involved in cell wall biosynthesis
MSHGVPVVATRVGGIPEIVADGETGRLVSPDRPGELAEALAQLLLDPERARRWGEAGWRRFRERFTAQRFVEETENLLLGLLQDRRAA